jgi:hypothetical protein
MQWARHLTLNEKKKYAYSVLVGKPEEKRNLKRPKQREEYNIKMYPEETGRKA